jgi:hypothetical protein
LPHVDSEQPLRFARGRIAANVAARDGPARCASIASASTDSAVAANVRSIVAGFDYSDPLP